MPPTVTSTFRSGSTARPSSALEPLRDRLAQRRRAERRRVGRPLRRARRPPRPRAAACRPPGWPPIASRFGYRSANARDGIHAGSLRGASGAARGRPRPRARARAPPCTRRPRARPSRPGRGRRSGSRRPRTPPRRRRPSCRPARACSPVTSVYASRSARESSWSKSISYAPRTRRRSRSIVQPVSAATASSSARYSASTASSVLPGAQRRVPTMRHSRRPAVVEVAAVHLADEVRLGADPRVLDRRQLRAPPVHRLDHLRRRDAAGAASRAASAARASACRAA